MQSQADDKQAQKLLQVLRQDISRQIHREVSSNEVFEGSLPVLNEVRTYSDNQIHESATVEKSKESILAADAAIKVARRKWMPDLSLQASATKSGDNLPINATQYSAGLVLTVPIYDPTVSPDVGAAAITRQKAELGLIKAQQDQDYALGQAKASLQNAAASLEVSLKQLEADSLQAEVYRQRYTLGLASFQDWDLVERDFIASEKNLLDARHEVADSFTGLELAKNRRLEDSSQ